MDNTKRIIYYKEKGKNDYYIGLGDVSKVRVLKIADMELGG